MNQIYYTSQEGFTVEPATYIARLKRFSPEMDYYKKFSCALSYVCIEVDKLDQNLAFMKHITQTF
jgi:hypothetical protein